MPRIIPEEVASPSGGFSGVDNGSQATFIYKPGGVANDNVYNSWASLYADFQQVSGPKIIQINDDSISPALIPSGNYNLMNAIIMGSSEIRDSYPIMQLENGAVFTAIEKFSNIDLRGNSNSPSIVISASKQIIFEESIITVLSGKSPIVSSSSSLDIVLDRSTLGGSETIFDITSGTTNFYVKNQSNITSDVIDSSLGSVIDFECVDSNVTINNQSGISGSTNLNKLSDSEQVFYDNTLSGLVSSDVQSAIDEIAGATGSTGSSLEDMYNYAYINYYTELTYSGDDLSSVEVWEDDFKILKLFTRDLIYTGDDLTQVITTDEINGDMLIKDFSYSGGNLISILTTVI